MVPAALLVLSVVSLPDVVADDGVASTTRLVSKNVHRHFVFQEKSHLQLWETLARSGQVPHD